MCRAITGNATRLRAAFLVGVQLALSSAHSTPLPPPAAALHTQAQSGRWYQDAAKLNPDLLPTSDGQSFLVAWKPNPTPKRWLVTLHGSRGFATDDLAIWHRTTKDRDLGIVALQWWLGRDDESYYQPLQAYREIDNALQKLNVQPGTVLFHGFSRGAANAYAVAAIDAGRGRRYFALNVASSGGMQMGYPPTRAIVEGRFGERPLKGTRWATAAGGRDENPDRDGVPAMRRTADWLREQGATVIEQIEDANEGHGALQRNPRNAQRLLDLFLKN